MVLITINYQNISFCVVEYKYNKGKKLRWIGKIIVAFVHKTMINKDPNEQENVHLLFHGVSIIFSGTH